MFKKMISFLKQENPTIVDFKDGTYGIRKKDRWTNYYEYLDLQDISSSSSYVNWRCIIHRNYVYDWCTDSSIKHVYDIHTSLTRLLNNKVECVKLTQEQIDKLLEKG